MEPTPYEPPNEQLYNHRALGQQFASLGMQTRLFAGPNTKTDHSGGASAGFRKPTSGVRKVREKDALGWNAQQFGKVSPWSPN